jgi:hypothetical protein
METIQSKHNQKGDKDDELVQKQENKRPIKP